MVIIIKLRFVIQIKIKYIKNSSIFKLIVIDFRKFIVFFKFVTIFLYKEMKDNIFF